MRKVIVQVVRMEVLETRAVIVDEHGQAETPFLTRVQPTDVLSEEILEARDLTADEIENINKQMGSSRDRVAGCEPF